MSVLFLLIPLALLLGIAALVACIWSLRQGQYDDLDTPPMRMLFEDFQPRTPSGLPNSSNPRNEVVPPRLDTHHDRASLAPKHLDTRRIDDRYT